MVIDPITGRVYDKPSDMLPLLIDEKCEYCGSALISRCLSCGAPVCCPKCCKDSIEPPKEGE